MNLEKLQKKYEDRISKFKKRVNYPFFIPTKQYFNTTTFNDKPQITRLKRHIKIGNMLGAV